MTRKKRFVKFPVSFALAVVLASCATPQSLVTTGPSAELALNLQAHSTGGALGKHWHVWKFDDPTCEAEEKGVLAARKRRGKPFESIRLPAGIPITLAFWHIEANFGFNRECSYTWTFTPEADEKYRVDLSVSPSVACSIALNNASRDAVVDVTTPANSCVAGLLGRKTANGVPSTIIYQVSPY